MTGNIKVTEQHSKLNKTSADAALEANSKAAE